ncbi:uncharacterized protein BJ171DRAFT_565749 [Polychytrium aggregatum]|uniref:uncharacterized protein n=1 Tax=Polychytrium aggregatum TaxID=110093 RepID=UPI0022FE92A6|nr:uncharacterized protein BJ171DRAFT_565749 [Polychytrium aggregatum]KAI9208035.1 hypothetical protein BJ171DRAFT_565749 [Polychytrium aggregatum]
MIALPSDQPRDSLSIEPSYSRVAVLVIPDLVTAHIYEHLQAFLALVPGASELAVLLAAFAVFLKRYSSQSTLSIGTIFRDKFQSDPAKRQSPFDLLLQVNPSDTLTDLSLETQKAIDAAEDSLKYQTAFVNHTPTQVMLWLEDPDETVTNGVPGIPPISIAFPPCEILLQVNPAAGRAIVLYDMWLYKETTVSRMMAHFRNVLDHCLRFPVDTLLARIPMLSDEEHQQQIIEWNTRSIDPSLPLNKCLHTLFEETARQYAQETALVDPRGIRTSYAGLNQASNRLARYLRQLGVRPGGAVIVSVPRSANFVGAILAVLKAGASYIPVDDGQLRTSLDYLRLLTKDASPAAVIADPATSRLWLSLNLGCPLVTIESLASSLWQEFDDSNLNLTLPSSGRAYEVYSSYGDVKASSITHANIGNMAFWHRSLTSLTRSDRVAFLNSVSSSLSVSAIWCTILFGATLVCFDEASKISVDSIIGMCVREKVTIMHISTPLWRNYSHGDWSKTSLRFTLVNGDLLKIGPSKRFSGRLVNTFGPSEVSVFSLYHVVGPEEERPPLGRPITNTAAFILDDDLEPVPIGAPGELYLSGMNVGLGYRNRPSLTAARFIRNPFTVVGSAQMFRTGIIASYSSLGEIQYIENSKRRSTSSHLRIKPEEISSCIKALPGVQDCLVQFERLRGLGHELCAYVAIPDNQFGEERVRQYLSQRLPSFKIPAKIFCSLEIPYAIRDRADPIEVPSDSDSAGPSPLQITSNPGLLAGGDRRVPGQEATEPFRRTSSLEHFVGRGGDRSSGPGISRNLHQAQEPRAAEQRERLSLQSNSTVSSSSPSFSGIFSAPRKRVVSEPSFGSLLQPAYDSSDPQRSYPCSRSQSELAAWQIQHKHASVGNFPVAIEVEGKLDERALALSIDLISRRHLILRTLYGLQANGATSVSQRVQNDGVIPLDHLTLPSSAAFEDLSANETVGPRMWQPFDLEREFPIRLSVIEFEGNATQRLLLIVTHRVVTDKWSVRLLMEELFECYIEVSKNPAFSPPSPECQYIDMAVWEQQFLETPEAHKQLSFWHDRLKNIHSRMDIPTDFARPAKPSYKTATHWFELEYTLVESVRAFSRDWNVSVEQICFTAICCLLHLWTGGRSDVVVTREVTNRRILKFSGAIGRFANYVLDVVNFNSQSTFNSVLDFVRNLYLEDAVHQEVPLPATLDHIRKNGNAEPPVPQILFTYINSRRYEAQRIGGSGGVSELGIRRLPIRETVESMFDLAFLFEKGHEGKLIGSIEYQVELWDASTIRDLVQDLALVLETTVMEPIVRVNALPMSLVDSRISAGDNEESGAAASTDDRPGQLDSEISIGMARLGLSKRAAGVFAEPHRSRSVRHSTVPLGLAPAPAVVEEVSPKSSSGQAGERNSTGSLNIVDQVMRMSVWSLGGYESVPDDSSLFRGSSRHGRDSMRSLRTDRSQSINSIFSIRSGGRQSFIPPRTLSRVGSESESGSNNWRSSVGNTGSSSDVGAAYSNSSTWRKDSAAPTIPDALELLALLKQALDESDLRLQDDFWESGGDLSSARELCDEVKKRYRVRLTVDDLATMESCRDIVQFVQAAMKKQGFSSRPRSGEAKTVSSFSSGSSTPSSVSPATPSYLRGSGLISPTIAEEATRGRAGDPSAVLFSSADLDLTGVQAQTGDGPAADRWSISATVSEKTEQYTKYMSQAQEVGEEEYNKLTMPVPGHPEWRKVDRNDGLIYYFNIKTHETSWEPPGGSAAPSQKPAGESPDADPRSGGLSALRMTFGTK